MRITTLIPASEPECLRVQLAALINQTVRPYRIIISDQSTGQSITAELPTLLNRAKYSDLTIDVIPGSCTPAATVSERCEPLLRRFESLQDHATELLHLLVDRSVMAPGFYEKHFEAHRSGVVQCAVGQPWPAFDADQSERMTELPRLVTEPDYQFLALNSLAVFELTLGPPVPRNWLGGFSNATFRAAMAKELLKTDFEGISFLGQEALGAFLKASINAPLGFIRLQLGHDNPGTALHAQPAHAERLAQKRLALFALAIGARRLGLVSAEQCGMMFANWGSFVLQAHSQEFNVSALCKLLPALAAGERNTEARFIRTWHEYVERRAIHAKQ